MYAISQPLPLNESGCDAFSRLGIAYRWYLGEFADLVYSKEWKGDGSRAKEHVQGKSPDTLRVDRTSRLVVF